MRYIHTFNEAKQFKDLSNVINILNKKYNILGISFTKDGLGGIYVDMNLLSTTISIPQLFMGKSETKFCYLCYDNKKGGGGYEGTRIKGLKLMLPNSRSTLNVGIPSYATRYRITNDDNETIEQVKNILIFLIRRHKNFSVYGWPSNAIAIIEGLNELLFSCVSDDFKLPEEDAKLLYDKICQSKNALEIINEIHKNVPNLWNIFKKYENAETISNMAQSGF